MVIWKDENVPVSVKDLTVVERR